MNLDKYRSFLEKQRLLHLQRNQFKRCLVVVAGAFLILVSLPLLILLTEVAIPLLLIGLTLMALEFDWAHKLLHILMDYLERLLRKHPDLKSKKFVAAFIILSIGLLIFIFWLLH